MIEDYSRSGNKSGNTYIQFSFEKSLRKYQKPPSKKIKTNQCINNNNSTVFNNSVKKLYQREKIQLSDRQISKRNSCKNDYMRSRQMARQFSQIKKKIQFSNSAKKSKQNLETKQLQNSWNKIEVSIAIPDPFSEFNLGQQMNLRDLRRDAVLNLSLNKELARRQYFEVSGIKKMKENEMQNQLSIQRILRMNNCMQFGMLKQDNSIRKKLDMFDLDCKQGDERIIEQQNEQFSQTSITQSNLVIHSNLLFNNFKQSNTDEQKGNKIFEYPFVSCAYFSSCSSIQSFQNSLKCFNDQSHRSAKSNNQIQAQKSSNDEVCQKSNNIFDEENPFMHLKLQSKEQLKKQIRHEYRQRVFYQIKKIGLIEHAYSECQSLSQGLKKQLNTQINNQIQRQSTKNSQLNQFIQITNPLQEQCSSLMRSHIENAIEMENEDFSNYDRISDSLPPSHQNQNSFKRARPYSAANNEGNQSVKRKVKKINFQIDQNYKRLGRVKITGLGQANESICLSIRRFTHQIKQTSSITAAIERQSTFIDQIKIINYLIAQRPYLEKNRPQLTELLCNLIESNQNNTQQSNIFQ